jgi:hypothetical protein
MNQEKLSFYTDEAALTRYEEAKRRKLSNMAIRIQRDPSYRESPDELEGVVDISEGEEE